VQSAAKTKIARTYSILNILIIQNNANISSILHWNKIACFFLITIRHSRWLYLDFFFNFATVKWGSVKYFEGPISPTRALCTMLRQEYEVINFDYVQIFSCAWHSLDFIFISFWFQSTRSLVARMHAASSQKRRAGRLARRCNTLSHQLYITFWLFINYNKGGLQLILWRVFE